VRNKVVKCYATVRQVGDKFERGEMPHKHPGEPGLSLKKINLELGSKPNFKIVITSRLNQHI